MTLRPLTTDALMSVLRLQNDVLSGDLDSEAVRAIVCERAITITDADAAVVELVEDDAMVYVECAGSARGHEGLRLPIRTSLSGRCVLEQQVLRCDDGRTDPRVNREAALAVGAISMLCVPLLHRGSAVGVLKVYANRPSAFGEGDVAILGALSGAIGAHMAHAAAYERALHDRAHDALTGLPNRRAYDERLAQEVLRAQRYATRLSLAVFDLDGFKTVNDRFGHDAGDAVLRAFADVLRDVRVVDQCFRTGGDEFAVLMPETALDGAERVARRVADALAVLPAARGIVTASYGIALLAGESAPELHRAADLALGDAKRGRATARFALSGSR